MERTFEGLVGEAESAAVTGWDFSWLDGRATEQRPSWGYQRLLRQRLSTVQSALDIDTGGGEVLAGAGPFPPTMAATESWPPNLALATQRLHPLGVVVVGAANTPKLPFSDEAFDLVSSRHPANLCWPEIARVLTPGGAYFAQHVGPDSHLELIEQFQELPADAHTKGHPDVERAAAEEAGLKVVDLRQERIRVEFFDIGAVVYFLRKVIWAIPGFTVATYRNELLRLHRKIEAEGRFVASTSRVLIEATKF
ncbi:class I SAM-dependent methyltransferase [Mycobacterium eburneum]|nr:class I SAM-dependent methyltransferase [Mycobacterium eburneum]TDH47939.1 class I SAM-dependent methyltransferase [Mycobacterium eburneum]